MMNFVEAAVRHVALDLAQVPHDLQISAPSLLDRFAQNARLRLLALFQAPAWHLDPGFRTVRVSKHEKSIAVSYVCVDFLPNDGHGGLLSFVQLESNLRRKIL